MPIRKVRLDSPAIEKPQLRKRLLTERLRELNARGEQELAALMENIEKLKSSFRSGRK